MELIFDARLRTALHFVASLSEHGVPDGWPTGPEIEAYVDDCERGSFESIFGTTGMIGAMRLGVGMSRSLAQRLVELGWALQLDHHGSIATTDLGLSVHQAMLAEQRAAAGGEITEVRLGGGREIAWETLIESLSKFDDYMLVDPYLERKQLKLLMRDTSLTQAMTAFKDDRQAQKRRRELQGVVDRLSQFGDGAVPLAIHVTESSKLHDRFLIVGKDVWTLGVSLNGVGKNPSLLVKLGSTASDVRADNLDLWNKASPLVPVAGGEAGEQ